MTAQLLTGKGSFSQRWSNVSWKQVAVAGVAGGLSGGVSAIAGTAATTAGAVAANVVGNAGVGALAVQANAKVEGKTASASEVLNGAALSGGAAGLGSVVKQFPGALRSSARSGMSQTEVTATENFFDGIKKATPGFKYSDPTQSAANVLGGTISATPEFKSLLFKKRDEQP